jgi:hypothetical protein
MACGRPEPEPELPASRLQPWSTPTSHLPCSSDGSKLPTAQQTRPTPAPGGVPIPGERRQVPRPVTFRRRFRVVIAASPGDGSRLDPEAVAGAASIRRLLQRPCDPEAAWTLRSRGGDRLEADPLSCRPSPSARGKPRLGWDSQTGGDSPRLPWSAMPGPKTVTSLPGPETVTGTQYRWRAVGGRGDGVDEAARGRPEPALCGALPSVVGFRAFRPGRLPSDCARGCRALAECRMITDPLKVFYTSKTAPRRACLSV